MESYDYKYQKYKLKLNNLILQKKLHYNKFVMSGGAEASGPKGKNPLIDYLIPKDQFKQIEQKLKKIYNKNLDIPWFPNQKRGLREFLEKRAGKIKRIREDITDLISELKDQKILQGETLDMLLPELNNILNQSLEYNKYRAFYLIGDPRRKRDLDLLVVVTENAQQVPLSQSEYQRLLSEVRLIDPEKVDQGKLDLNFINMDSNNNITLTSKGQKKFTQSILHFTYGLNQQRYRLDPLTPPNLPSDNSIILNLELVNYIDSIIMKVLSTLKDFDPENYKRGGIQRDKTRVFNSDSETKLNYVVGFVNQWLDQKRSKPLSTKQQDILKSMTIKILQFLLWKIKFVNPDFFTKEGALNMVISRFPEFRLNKDEIMRVLYIRSDDNQTSEYFRPIWEIFKVEAPKYLWELPGFSTLWNVVRIDTIDGDDLLNAVRTNVDYIPEIGDLYQRRFPDAIPAEGEILVTQTNFVDILNPADIAALRNLLPRLIVSDLNPRSPEWLAMLSDPRYKFGDNTGIKPYVDIPDWRTQLKNFYHLLQGLVAEQDVISKFPFTVIFPGFKLMEVGALIDTSAELPNRGVCPDGLLVKESEPKEIIPIEIKKIKLTSSREIERELDLASRQLAGTKDLINKNHPGLVNYSCLIMYDFHNYNVYYRVI